MRVSRSKSLLGSQEDNRDAGCSLVVHWAHKYKNAQSSFGVYRAYRCRNAGSSPGVHRNLKGALSAEMLELSGSHG